MAFCTTRTAVSSALLYVQENALVLICVVDRDSSVGMATSFGVDGPGNESRWGRDFPHTSIPALRPTRPPIQWVPGNFRV